MCGIVGLAVPWGAPADAELLDRMCETLSHRGPDDRGGRSFAYGRGPGAALGHTRLSILDLSPNGRQPMANEDGSVHLTCNGEVYNHAEIRGETERRGHRYRSRTDVESILHLYEDEGTGCPARLNGMFAFGLWDERRRSLLLARDRAGIKPLYYASRDGRLAFASELKALLPLPWVRREIDPEALDLYLSLLYIPAPWSIFKDIRKLPAGHRLVWEDGEIKVEPYFGLPISDCGMVGPKGLNPQSAICNPRSFERAAEDLLAHLERSVRAQLQGDVPAGALLSGGLDSSLIVALMSRCTGKPVPTFCVGFRGGGHYDERPYARKVARLFGAEHVEEELDPSLEALLPGLVRAFDEPFGDASAIPTLLVARTAGRHVKVVLSGTGSDELLGGYRRHVAGPVLRALGRLPGPVLRAMGALLSLLPNSRKSLLGERVLLGQRLLAAAQEGDANAYLRLITFLDPRTLGLLWKPASRGAERLYAGVTGGLRCFLDRALAFDRSVYLPDDLLVKEDRASMAASVEGRVPFLDNRMVDFAAGLPASFRIQGRTTKPLLKQAALGLLPESVIHRPKHGFGVPISEWLRGDLGDPGHDLITGLSRRGLFDPHVLADLWAAHRSGGADHGPMLWGLMVFELWHREYAG